MLLLLLQAHRAEYGSIAGALLSTKRCQLRVQYAAFIWMYLHSNLKRGWRRQRQEGGGGGKREEEAGWGRRGRADYEYTLKCEKEEKGTTLP